MLNNVNQNIPKQTSDTKSLINLYDNVLSIKKLDTENVYPKNNKVTTLDISNVNTESIIQSNESIKNTTIDITPIIKSDINDLGNIN